MTDRTTKVTLLAQVNGYVDGMQKAARSTALVGSEAEKLAQKRQAFEGLGRGLLTVGGAIALATAVAIKRFADFDQAISNVKAATQETTENMLLLRDAALDAGGRTVFTAVQAANAIEELGKNGLTTAQILGGGLDTALGLAAAGQLDVARAAEIAAITMKQFKLTGDQLPHVADLIAAGAGKAAGDVEDLAQALAQSGLVAKQTGLSIEETTGVLSAFADAGLIGSDAGTSFKTMLQRLTPQSAEARDELDRLGISAYDSQGNFVGAAKFAGILKDGLTGLTKEQQNTSLAVIFGSDAVRAATVFYNNGAEGIQKYIDQTNDAGYAAKVAADRLDNLNGDIEKLGGSIDTYLIRSGSGANEVLRGLVQGVTFLVDAFGDAPAPALEAALAIGTVVAVTALLGGTALSAAPKIAALKVQLSTMGVTARTAAVGIGLVGGAVGVALVLVGAFISAQADAKASSDEFAASLDETTGALTAYSRELIAKKLQERGAFDLAAQAGISQKELTDAIYEGGDAYEAITKKAREFELSNVTSQPTNSRLRTSIEEINGELEGGREAYKNLKEATEDNTTTIDQFSGKVQDATGDLKALKEAIEGFGAAQLDVNDATRSFEAAIDDAAAAVAENGANLDLSTEAGRANSAALDGIAKSALDMAAAVLEQTGSQELASAAIGRGRDEVVKAATALLGSEDAANKYADSLGLIPANVATAVVISGLDDANSKLSTLAKRLGAIQPNSVGIGVLKSSGLNPSAFNENGGLYNNGVRAFANGGFPTGIYAGRPGGIHKFAEENVGWEAYISGKPGQETRNRGIWAEAGQRLGVPAPTASGSVSVPVQVVNRSGVRLTELIDMQIQQNGLWQSVDLDGGLTQ